MKRPATDGKGQLRRFFSPKAFAEALSLNKRTVLRMIERKEILAYQVVGNEIRIPEDELNRLLRERSIGRPAA